MAIWTCPRFSTFETCQLNLSALLSQALVAFTIEFDNEFEHRAPHRTTNQGSMAGSRHGALAGFNGDVVELHAFCRRRGSDRPRVGSPRPPAMGHSRKLSITAGWICKCASRFRLGLAFRRNEVHRNAEDGARDPAGPRVCELKTCDLRQNIYSDRRHADLIHDAILSEGLGRYSVVLQQPPRSRYSDSAAVKFQRTTWQGCDGYAVVPRLANENRKRRVQGSRPSSFQTTVPSTGIVPGGRRRAGRSHPNCRQKRPAHRQPARNSASDRWNRALDRPCTRWRANDSARNPRFGDLCLGLGGAVSAANTQTDKSPTPRRNQTDGD